MIYSVQVNKVTTPTERMVRVETEINNEKSNQEIFRKENKIDHDKIFNKIDAFIDAAQQTYATKSELRELKLKIADNTQQDIGWRRNIVPVTISLITLVVVIITLFMKLQVK